MVKHEMYIHINNTMSYPLNKRIDIYLTDLVDNDDNYKQGYIFIVRDHNSIEEKIRVFSLESLESKKFEDFIRNILVDKFDYFIL